MKVFLYLIIVLQLGLQIGFEFVSCNPLNDNFKELKREKRWAFSTKNRLWPSNTIHYKISCTQFTKEQLELIKTSYEELMNRTCLEIVKIDDSSDYKDFVDIKCIEGGECTSKLGYVGGAQHLNLKISNTTIRIKNCLSRRKIQHEFLHALGFKHEHTNPNRDDFLQLNYDNMEPGWDKYFAKDKFNKLSSYGCEFDYNSVMMPPAYKHSINGLPTLTPKDDAYTSKTIGIAHGVSDCDITRLNNIYCSKKEDNDKNK